jgi:hypothetical protein
MEAFIPITMFMCIAAVAILRPLTTRLGGLIEAMTRDRIAGASPVPHADDSETARVRVLIEHISSRVDLIEERLDFTERLVAGSRRPAGHLRDESFSTREEPLRP